MSMLTPMPPETEDRILEGTPLRYFQGHSHCYCKTITSGDSRCLSVNLIVQVRTVDALDVIRTGRIQVTIVEILCGFKDLILSESRQERISLNFGSAVAMSSKHEDSNDLRIGLRRNYSRGQKRRKSELREHVWSVN